MPIGERYRRRLARAAPCGWGPREGTPHAVADGSSVPVATPSAAVPPARRAAAFPLLARTTLLSPTAKPPPAALAVPETDQSKSVVPVGMVDQALPLKRNKVPAAPVATRSVSVRPQIAVSGGAPGCSEFQLLPLYRSATPAVPVLVRPET
jgi:hypothetical protein